MDQNRQTGPERENVKENAQAGRVSSGRQGRNATIGEIACLLAGMNDRQLENMHTYAVDEYREQDHEAEALEAVVRLSRKYGKRNREE